MIASCSTYYLYTVIKEEQHLKQAVKNNHILHLACLLTRNMTYSNENREGYRERAVDEYASHLDISFIAFFFHLQIDLIVANMVNTAAGEIQKKAERYLELCTELKAEVSLADETKITTASRHLIDHS